MSLQTCFAGPARHVDPRAVTAAADAIELIPAWGAPDGLCYGGDAAALDDLLDWIALAAAAGCSLMRIVLGGPRLRTMPLAARLERVQAPLATASAAARQAGVTLAVENHGDLAAEELEAVLDLAGCADLGICFDTGNAIRVGDDVVAAARRLGCRVRMVHLKDVRSGERSIATGPESVAYGTGSVDLDGTLTALTGAGFDGPVCVELGQLGPGADEDALVASGLEWLRARGIYAVSA